MAAEEIGERHLELLGVLDELTKSDPDGVADMDKAAQRISGVSLRSCPVRRGG
jgi:hypothetical protein